MTNEEYIKLLKIAANNPLVGFMLGLKALEIRQYQKENR